MDDQKNSWIGFQVINKSFTGRGGCVVNWNLEEAKENILDIKQRKGDITGDAIVEKLFINLYRGSVRLKNGKSPLQIIIEEGNAALTGFYFNGTGESSIKVGTGNITVTSLGTLLLRQQPSKPSVIQRMTLLKIHLTRLINLV